MHSTPVCFRGSRRGDLGPGPAPKVILPANESSAASGGRTTWLRTMGNSCCLRTVFDSGLFAFFDGGWFCKRCSVAAIPTAKRALPKSKSSAFLASHATFDGATLCFMTGEGSGCPVPSVGAETRSYFDSGFTPQIRIAFFILLRGRRSFREPPSTGLEEKSLLQAICLWFRESPTSKVGCRQRTQKRGEVAASRAEGRSNEGVVPDGAGLSYCLSN
jgi:hypothetical protein